MISLTHGMQQAGVANIPLLDPKLTRTAGLLDKDVELLHLPLPHHQTRYLIMRAGALSDAMSDEELVAACSLHIWVCLPPPRNYGSS